MLAASTQRADGGQWDDGFTPSRGVQCEYLLTRAQLSVYAKSSETKMNPTARQS